MQHVRTPILAEHRTSILAGHRPPPAGWGIDIGHRAQSTAHADGRRAAGSEGTVCPMRTGGVRPQGKEGARCRPPETAAARAGWQIRLGGGARREARGLRGTDYSAVPPEKEQRRCKTLRPRKPQAPTRLGDGTRHTAITGQERAGSSTRLRRGKRIQKKLRESNPIRKSSPPPSSSMSSAWAAPPLQPVHRRVERRGRRREQIQISIRATVQASAHKLEPGPALSVPVELVRQMPIHIWLEWAPDNYRHSCLRLAPIRTDLETELSAQILETTIHETMIHATSGPLANCAWLAVIWTI
ncbi:hypothetical protein FB451DRAFT_1573022 [Mycena latifolia]|nr:hypothetical protein FB451DRAFT_1573022 [Mycena latifolia]